jgi:hypothetical protein
LVPPALIAESRGGESRGVRIRDARALLIDVLFLLEALDQRVQRLDLLLRIARHGLSRSDFAAAKSWDWIIWFSNRTSD